MNSDNGRIYGDLAEIDAARRRGEPLVEVSPAFASQFVSGSTEAQRAAQTLQRLKSDMPWLSQVELEKRAREAAR